jgi:hypothetical protein
MGPAVAAGSSKGRSNDRRPDITMNFFSSAVDAVTGSAGTASGGGST